MKKRFAIIVCMVIFCLTPSSCNPVISIGKSTEFNTKEIQSAVNCVLAHFKVSKGVKLNELWYDEEMSNKAVKDYMLYGSGLKNGIKSENVIVLFSDFRVDPAEDVTGVGTATNWSWTLIRDSKTCDWRIGDNGY